MDARTCIKAGFVHLGNQKLLFHSIKSTTLANLLQIPGDLVPIPLLFQKYGPDQEHLPLYKPNTPSLSIVRLVLSVHPYALNSSLIIGCQHLNGQVTVFTTPMIAYADFTETPIKVESVLMLCSDDSMCDAVEITPEELTKLEKTKKKRVAIQETLNKVKMFEPKKALKKTKKGAVSSLSPAKPILVMSPQSVQHVQETESHYFARLYYTMVAQVLKVGACSMSAFNTIIITAQSQNTVNLLPEEQMNNIQRLFVKHVILHRMGLENSLFEFKELYTPMLLDIPQKDVEKFEDIVSASKQVAEDIIFCLNSICEATFPKKVEGTTAQNMQTAMEKYFLMFAPNDRENAIPFAASIVEIICKGTPLCKVVKYLEKYMEIKECIPKDNLIKTYALLTI